MRAAWRSIWERRRTGPTDTYRMLVDEHEQIYGVSPSSFQSRQTARTLPPDRAPGGGWKPAAGRAGDDERWAEEADERSLAALRELYQDFHAAYPRSALCLSGGGIRSAAFALGVIQHLAKTRLLDKFTYLSTVSGGGYIGSWLSAWLHEAKDYEAVRRRMSERADPDIESRAIRHLRENSNFLTPKTGLVSADTWATAAILLRNLLLNWLIVVPFICVAALVPQVAAAWISVPGFAGPWLTLLAVCFVLAVLLYLAALLALNGGRPQWRIWHPDQGRFLGFVLAPALLGAVLWAAVVVWSGNFAQLPPPAGALLSVGTGAAASLLSGAAVGAALYVAALLLIHVANRRCDPSVYVAGAHEHAKNIAFQIRLSRAARRRCSVEVFTEDRQGVAGLHYAASAQTLTFEPGAAAKDFVVALLDGANIDGERIKQADIFVRFRNPSGVRLGILRWRSRAWELLGYAVAGSIFGVLLALGAMLYRTAGPAPLGISKMLFLVVCGVPWFMIAHALAEAVFVGVSSRAPRSDEEREWLGRAGGWVLVAAVAWLATTAIVLLLPPLLPLLADHYGERIVSAGLGAVGGVSGIATALLGGGPKTQALSGAPESRLRRSTLYVAALVFLVTLVMALSFGINWALFGNTLHAELTAEVVQVSRLLEIAVKLTLAALALPAAAIGLGRFVNINRFSLHEVYRNRLVRAFLGASNRDRSRRDRFTSFNFTDNVNMCALWARREPADAGAAAAPRAGREWKPFHVVTIALNLVSTRNAAWQERKAASFTVTPLWCGSAALQAFRRASEYGGLVQPITLGTAMAISGAAVSPNMGYNSSPLITFLLTLFNIRLGWWFGNPRQGSFRFEGPRLAAFPLLIELFGLTNARRRYVYLSDGGHFENLGLYEMVRRRCHLVVLCDAGQDRDIGLADLANATRKIAIDLGVPIAFGRLNCLRKRNDDLADPEKGGPCWTVGRIRYSEADPGGRDGYILYLKPGFRGDEPADVLGYAADSKDFPHETTADQWFSESQFESYRALGWTICARAHHAALQWQTTSRPGQGVEDDVRFAELETFLQAAWRSERPDPPSAAAATAAIPAHVEALTESP